MNVLAGITVPWWSRPSIHTQYKFRGNMKVWRKISKKLAIVSHKMMLLFSKRNYFIKISVLVGQNDGFFLNVN